MWCYEKRLMLPINIKNKNPKLAKMILTQFGGYAGELGAALRYLTMRYTMPTDEGKALLTDIGTEELAHIEMINTIISFETMPFKFVVNHEINASDILF